jgi:hypothetical protein
MLTGGDMGLSEEGVCASHNRIKDDLIDYWDFGRAVTPQKNATLLDLRAGYVGDIARWYENSIHTVVGRDVEPASVIESIRGYRTFRNRQYTAYTFHAIAPE